MMKLSSWIVFASLLLVAGCKSSPPAATDASGDNTTKAGTTTGAPAAPQGVHKLTKLGIKDLKPGDNVILGVKVGNPKPVENGDLVTVEYTGKLTDGTVFDSNLPGNKVGHAQPLIFYVGRGMVVQGFDQGLLGMHIGGEREIAIPASMGYGPQDMKDADGNVKIPGNSDLYFTIKLLDVVKQGDEGTWDFKDIKPGEGREIKKGDTVSIRYTGMLEDGTVFDSNEKGDPYQFTIGEIPPKVISGMEAGVTGMKKGGIRLLRLPPAIAYGTKNVSGIPPNSTLIFKVEVVDVI